MSRARPASSADDGLQTPAVGRRGPSNAATVGHSSRQDDAHPQAEPTERQRAGQLGGRPAGVARPPADTVLQGGRQLDGRGLGAVRRTAD